MKSKFTTCLCIIDKRHRGFKRKTTNRICVPLQEKLYFQKNLTELRTYAKKVETTNVELQSVLPVPRNFVRRVNFLGVYFALLGLKVGWPATVGMRGMPGGPLIS